MRYNDVFPNTAPHITEVCRELTGVYGNASSFAAPTQWVYTLCPHHNCTDEECNDYPQMILRLGR
jgi:hypothetical protein